MDYKSRNASENFAKSVPESKHEKVSGYRMIENELLPIYENEKKEKLVNTRELHIILKNKRKFTDWIKQRIEQYEFVENSDFICFSQNCEKPVGGRPSLEYYITVDMAKQLSMVENNDVGKQMRKYFIEVEKRYRTIIESPTNIFDFMRLALDQIECNEKEIQNVKMLTENNTKQIQEIQSKIDVTIKKDYCLASDIAE
ncbi:MAG: antA/AntB antirepressor family protein [Clostridia bacterium]